MKLRLGYCSKLMMVFSSLIAGVVVCVIAGIFYSEVNTFWADELANSSDGVLPSSDPNYYTGLLVACAIAFVCAGLQFILACILLIYVCPKEESYETKKGATRFHAFYFVLYVTAFFLGISYRAHGYYKTLTPYNGNSDLIFVNNYDYGPGFLAVVGIDAFGCIIVVVFYNFTDLEDSDTEE